MLRPSWIEMLVSSRIRVVAPIAAIAGVAVGHGAVAAQPSPTAVDPQKLLDRAIGTMQALDSYSFEFEAMNGEIELIPEVFTIHELDGDVVRPDAFQAESQIEVVFIDVDIKIVTLGEDTWVTNPLVLVGSDNDMVRIGELDFDSNFNPAWAVNPDHIALPLLGVIQDPVVAQGNITGGLTQIDGVITREGLNDIGDVFSDATISGLIADDLADLPISVWIDSEDLVRRLDLVGKLFGREDSDLVRSFTFDNFDEPVTIDRP